MPRIRIAESVMQKAGSFGLQSHSDNLSSLSSLLKKMARLSAVASRNQSKERRRYGAFILIVKNNTVIDINCNAKWGKVCIDCLGVGVDTATGEDCHCI